MVGVSLLVLAACGGSPRADGGLPDSGLPDSGLPDSGLPDSGAPDSGLPDSGDPLDLPPPAWSAAEVGQRVEALAAWPVPHPVRLRDVYLSALAAGDATCPGEGGSVADGSIPLGGCTATTGWTYEGLSSYSTSTDADLPARWFALDLGDLYVTDPEGRVLVFAGTFAWQGQQDGAATTFAAEATGSFVAPAEAGWLQPGATVALWVDGATTPGASALTAEGGVGTLGTGEELYLDGLHWGELAGPEGQPACGEVLAGAHPAGTVATRDPGGAWYRLTLGADCTGCGSVVYGGQQDLGEACVDLRALGSALLTELAAP